MLSVKSDFYRTHGWGRRLEDAFTGVSTSSRRHFRRRHLVSKMATPEMTSSRTWGGFFDPYCGGGARWRPFRFRSPSWMTSFAESEMRSSKMATGSGRAAILRRRRNRDRKNRPILLLMHERRNSIANALELRLSCTNPSISNIHPVLHSVYISVKWCPGCAVSLNDWPLYY